MIDKVSAITAQDIADYINATIETETDKSQIETYINIAKNYISNYTGRPISSEGAKTLDDYPDFVIVVYILCQDMYDNRTLYVEKGAFNKTVKTILDMHTMNNI